MRSPYAMICGLRAWLLAALLLAGSCGVDWESQIAEGVEREQARMDEDASTEVLDDEAARASETDEDGSSADSMEVGASVALVPPDAHLWFRADRGLSVDSSGRVLAWEDQSGHGASAWAELEGLAPGTQRDSPLPLVTFDGSQELRITDVPPIDALTFFAVAGSAVEDRNCPSILHLSNSADGIVQTADLEFGRHHREFYYESGTKSVPLGVMHTDSFSVGTLHVLSVRHEPSSLAVTRVDGRDVHSRQMELPLAVTRSHNFIGHNYYYDNGKLGCERLLGSIAELILYARVLDEDERVQVERYLSEKWNVPLRAGL